MENKSAVYMRLSREDGDRQESESIRSQRALIHEFADKHPTLHLVSEYADDGWSGTNFERPDFKRMMNDAAKGRINCIIVKDLSRFGRNYIGMGKFMERILPSMGIRLIAINDNYDSADNRDADNIIVPFKNLLNDSYSRDISKKIRSQLDVKRKRGDFIGNYAAYGYKKDEKNHNHLVPDEYAAAVVHDIFDWKMEGMGCLAIARKLNEKGVLCPMAYHKMRGVNLNSGFRGKGTPKWSPGSVGHILRNELYIGIMQQGKHRKTNYKLKELIHVPRENWMRVEGTHEAIVDPDVFHRVQELLEMDTSTTKNVGDNLFIGIAKCADCGQNMVRRGGRGKKSLICSSHRDKLDCGSHVIIEDELSARVLEAVKAEVTYVLRLEKTLAKVRERPIECRENGALEHIRSLGEEMERYKHLRTQLYDDLNEGIITQDEYEDFHANFSDKLESVCAAKKQAEKELADFRTLDTRSLGFLKIFKKYRHATKLDRRTVVELIDRIDVKDKEHVTVTFRFADQIESMARFCGEEDAE